MEILTQRLQISTASPTPTPPSSSSHLDVFPFLDLARTCTIIRTAMVMKERVYNEGQGSDSNQDCMIVSTIGTR